MALLHAKKSLHNPMKRKTGRNDGDEETCSGWQTETKTVSNEPRASSGEKTAPCANPDQKETTVTRIQYADAGCEIPKMLSSTSRCITFRLHTIFSWPCSAKRMHPCHYGDFQEYRARRGAWTGLRPGCNNTFARITLYPPGCIPTRKSRKDLHANLGAPRCTSYACRTRV